MATLQYYAKEREALILLKQRVEEYIADPCDTKREALQKGVNYINEKFPFIPESIEPLINNTQ